MAVKPIMIDCSFNRVTVEFADGHKMTFLPVKSGLEEIIPPLAGFYLEHGGQVVVQFHGGYQRPVDLPGRGFQKVKDNYKGYTVQMIVEYWEAAIEKVEFYQRANPKRSAANYAVSFIVTAGRHDLSDVKSNRYGLPFK